MLGRVTDPNYQADLGLLLHNGGKEEYVWNTGDPFGHLLILPCSMIKVNRKYNNPMQAGLLMTQMLQE